MKTKLLLFAFMLFCMACNNNKPLTENEKQVIIGEVKQVNEAFLRAFEQCKTDTILTMMSLSEGMMYPFGKKMVNSGELADAIKFILGTMNYQKHTMISENYAVIDKNTVWFSEIGKWETYFRDGKVLTQEPWYLYALYKKTGNAWKVATMTENGHSEITKADTLKKELDQLELAKQWIGTWRYELSKDSVVLADYQEFGLGLAGNIKLLVNGKLASEGKRLWGYNKLLNVLIRSNLNKLGSAGASAYWFKTPTTYEAVSYINVTDPSVSFSRYEGEFVSKDKIIEKFFRNDQLIRTTTYTRVK